MRTLITIVFALLSSGALSQEGKDIEKLAFGESDEKIEAIAALVASGTPKAAEVLQALADGELYTAGKRVLMVKGDTATDAVTGEKIASVPDEKEDITVNNRLRRELGAALAALKLISPQVEVRRSSVKELLNSAEPAMLPLVRKALAAESDPQIKAMLGQIAAALELRSEDRAARLAAVKKLADSNNASTKTLLLGFLNEEKDEELKSEARKSLSAIEGRLAWGERLGVIFTSVSLGSILLLAALGLAITYGLMGVINMAHGELIMIGAYATYVTQNLFKGSAHFDWYLIAAIPVAFLVSALVGMALERSVIRWLYGRPLETLLSTWGISLILIQAVRTIFGAQNVQVENPAFMSGGVEILTGIVLPWSRIVIIGFALFVLLGIWLLLNKTRLGLFVRGVTQNRDMASCVGVPTARVDTWAFGLGSGIAGLAGCALSQIGNVGPDLGQSYIVDSFMVVVLGGVGQLAGTVYAALGLGFANKLLEAWQGAVLAKIAVLIFIIIFIQKRPQGMFALKGRAVES
ncbi:MAG: urea ABC transporter permease subunit UrtB [Betaproteobacteria bacterium]|nr:urea ABC transporter permease subunit UrtB [Betaproteobacteria bacterium]